MSFVEDHKTWILPLLGLGAAAVVWINVRTFSPAAPGQEPQPVLESAPIPQAAPEAPPSPGIGEALWDDLRPVAFVPPELEARGALEQQALSSLPPEAFASPMAPPVLRPGGPEPGWRPRNAPGSGAGAPVAVPQADFLIEGPAGTQAWYDGHGYRAGQPLKGRPYTIQGIRIRPRPGVTLQGPPGSALRRPRDTPAPAPEIP
ncbi:MAG: hypothetical protein Q8K67_14460 [Geothrix sp.]|nr:hypothetical protein [Geothrix sp.]